MHQVFKHLARLENILVVSADFELVVPDGDPDRELTLNELDVLVKAAEKRDRVLGSAYAERIVRIKNSLYFLKSVGYYITIMLNCHDF